MSEFKQGNEFKSFFNIEETAVKPEITKILLQRDKKGTRKLALILQVKCFDFTDKDGKDIKGISFQTSECIVEDTNSAKGIEITKYSLIGDENFKLFKTLPKAPFLAILEIEERNKKTNLRGIVDVQDILSMGKKGGNL